MESLADFLRLPDQAPAPREEERIRFEDMTGEQFAQAVLRSREFYSYIVNSLALGTLPAAVVGRIMDMGGWTAPPKRVEHTGKDGAPIETVTTVRRVIVRAGDSMDEDEEPVVITRH